MIAHITLFMALCLLSGAHAGTVNWNGKGGNGLWGYGPNWDTNVIPTSNDDVFVNLGANVTIAAPAQCNTLTIGGGSSASYLLVQDTLTVGTGGVQVYAPSSLVLEASPASPFSSSGPVNFNGTNTLWFLTGAITGAGPWNIVSGSSVNFAGSGEKEVLATTLYNYGNVVITDGALVQLEQKGQLYNAGVVTITGSVTFLSQDGTGYITSKNTFTYAGVNNDTLNFQAQASFDSGITISSGYVVIQSSVTSSGFDATNAVVTVTGAAEFDASSSFATAFNSLIISPGSSVSTSAQITVNTLTLNQGKLSNTGTITATNALLQGGSLVGTNGVLNAAQLTFEPQNVPVTIDSGLTATGSVAISTTTGVLLDQDAIVNFPSSSNVAINAPTSFQLIGGAPSVTIDGQVTMTGDLTTYVPIQGSATYTISGRTLTLQAVTFSSGNITCDGCAINAQASQITTGDILGAGWYQIQANPSASFGTISAHSLVISAGNVDITSISSGEFNLTGGSVVLTSSSNVGFLNFFGGSIASSDASTVVQISANVTNVVNTTPKTLNAIKIYTSYLDLDCGQQCTLVLQNNAEIVNV